MQGLILTLSLSHMQDMFMQATYLWTNHSTSASKPYCRPDYITLRNQAFGDSCVHNMDLFCIHVAIGGEFFIFTCERGMQTIGNKHLVLNIYCHLSLLPFSLPLSSPSVPRLVDIENSLLGVPTMHRAHLLEIRKIYVSLQPPLIVSVAAAPLLISRSPSQNRKQP